MNITKKQIDDLNLEVVLKIEAADYAEEQKKKLNEIRRKAELKGFRKGMAPASLINRLYGGQVLYESVNAVINHSLNDFITENFYTCTPEILAYLGRVYGGGGEFTETIDAAGGEGTGAFACEAIGIYCDKLKS